MGHHAGPGRVDAPQIPGRIPPRARPRPCRARSARRSRPGSRSEPASRMREAPRTDASCSRHDHGPGRLLTWRSTVAGAFLTGPRRERFARPTTMRCSSAAALPASRSPRRRPVSSLVTPPSPVTSRPHGPARIQARPVFTDRRPPLSCSDWQTSPVSLTVVSRTSSLEACSTLAHAAARVTAGSPMRPPSRGTSTSSVSPGAAAGATRQSDPLPGKAHTH